VEEVDRDSILIEQLELFARVGVTESERAHPQRLTVSIRLWPREDFDKMQDDITRTVNYSAIAVATHEFAQERSDHLIETLVDSLAQHLVRLFPIRKISIELRKFVLPDAEYVAVMVTRVANAG
jgi:dihydroneopterin aldolase